MKLTAIVRGRLYEKLLSTETGVSDTLSIIAANHSVIADGNTATKTSGRFISMNSADIVGHYIITKG